MSFLPAGQNFRRFWFARVTSFAGDQVARVALVVMAAPEGPLATSMVLLALSLPRLVGPFGGALADMYSAKKIMVLTDSGQAVLFAAVALVPFDLAVSVPLIAVATLLHTLFLPAGRRSIPAMVASEELPKAFAAMAICFNAGFAAGPLLGGALLAVVDARVVVLVDAVTFLASIALIVRLDLPATPRALEHQAGYGRTLLVGFRELLSNRALGSVALGLFLVVSFAAMTTASLVFLTRDDLGGPTWSYGALVGVYGLGMLVGPAIFLGRVQRGRNPLRTWRFGQGLFGLGALTLGAAPWLGTAFASQAVAGAGNGIGNVATDLVVQSATPEHMLGTVSGVTMSIPFAASSLAYLVAVPLIDTLGPRWVIVIAGAGVLSVVTVIHALTPDPKPLEVTDETP
ncbi:MFS transporter [Nocardia tenerifensis]|uniref:MFS transporter n=1 Tax=Nocardia tenerifensis TaxID=228006 RepID=A0A318KBV5_9NOCA|nr:MFS transporter [Nocardia tenerifensis]PXX71596.1 MFS transporter [Nocardia tenerifensis]